MGWSEGALVLTSNSSGVQAAEGKDDSVPRDHVGTYSESR